MLPSALWLRSCASHLSLRVAVYHTSKMIEVKAARKKEPPPESHRKKRRTNKDQPSAASGSQTSRVIADEPTRKSPITPRAFTEEVTRLMHQRILIADLGFSSVPVFQELQQISWSQIAQVSDEQKAGILMFTGVHEKQMRGTLGKHFPHFEYLHTSTLGSNMIIAWHQGVWKKSEEASGTHVLCGSGRNKMPNERTALVAHLHRVDAEANTGDASSLAEENGILLTLTKFHRGTQDSGSAFDAHDRTTAWQELQKIVTSRGPKQWLIAGDLASNAVQLQQRVQELQPRNYSKGHGQTQQQQPPFNPYTLVSTDSTLACLAMGFTPCRIDNDDRPQQLVIEMPAIDTDLEDDADLADENPHQHTVPSRVLSRSEAFLKIIEAADDDGTHLVTLLHGPQTKRSWADDGSLKMEAATYQQCKEKLDLALNLIHDARQHATDGVNITRPLNDDQMNEALKYMRDFFRKTHLETHLAEAMNNWDSGTQYKPKAKDKIRHDFRGSFRAFLRNYVGDASAAYAILKHGYETPAALKGITSEIIREKIKRQIEKEAASSSQAVTPTRKTHPQLAARARACRQAHNRGERIAYDVDKGIIDYKVLDERQIELHRKYHTGILHAERTAANKAFAHGVPETLSLEQMAHMNYQFRMVGLQYQDSTAWTDAELSRLQD